MLHGLLFSVSAAQAKLNKHNKLTTCVEVQPVILIICTVLKTVLNNIPLGSRETLHSLPVDVRFGQPASESDFYDSPLKSK